jgi:hypothetical protein
MTDLFKRWLAFMIEFDSCELLKVFWYAVKYRREDTLTAGESTENPLSRQRVSVTCINLFNILAEADVGEHLGRI